ncbi:MAG: APC family permease [Burkholderiales bacterium]
MAKKVSPARRQNRPLKRVMGPWLLLLFIVGDILGTGIYALTGQVAKQVGGVVWLPFLVAFIVAVITAFSYLEQVTKYPRAAGAALYTHKAFGIHFVTFIVAFAVMCSGITSASTASRAFAANLSNAFGLDLAGGIGITLVGLAFMALVAAINFRGVGESVKFNVVLTCVELTGHLIIIFIGLWAIGHGEGNVSRVMEFKTSADGSNLSRK